jgi:hypothetical protein
MAIPIPDKNTREAVTFWLMICAATGPFVAMFFGLWLRANVPTKAEHEALAAVVSQHALTLAVMLEASKRDDRQDSLLTDHELRIRALENRRP